jgi:hypothetical protein
MRAGNRGREIDNAQAGEAPCQIPLIVISHGHSWSSLGLAAFRLAIVFPRGVTLNCVGCAGKRFPGSGLPGTRIQADA